MRGFSWTRKYGRKEVPTGRMSRMIPASGAGESRKERLKESEGDCMTRVGLLNAIGLVAVLALCAAVLVATTQARAQTQELEPQPVPYDENKERHCVASAVEAGSAGDSRMVCFKTFREAVYVATGGRIEDAPNDASKAATDGSFNDRLFAEPEQQAGDVSSLDVCCNGTVGKGKVVLSVEYEHINYRGNTLTYKAKSGCDRSRDIDWQSAYVGDRFNDEISSYAAGGGSRCQIKHFRHRDYGGASTIRKRQDANMGLFNDEASSIRWY
jgi:hypothetical protein